MDVLGPCHLGLMHSQPCVNAFSEKPGPPGCCVLHLYVNRGSPICEEIGPRPERWGVCALAKLPHSKQRVLAGSSRGTDPEGPDTAPPHHSQQLWPALGQIAYQI